MKHIKRFNEELKSSTYKSASNKLKNLHPKRAIDLLTHSDNMVRKSTYNRHKELVNKISKYGTYMVNISKDGVDFDDVECYIDINYYDDFLYDNIKDISRNSTNYGYITFSVYLIPVNFDDCIQIGKHIDRYRPELEIEFPLFDITITFKVDEENVAVLPTVNIEYSDHETASETDFLTRLDASIFKKTFLHYYNTVLSKDIESDINTYFNKYLPNIKPIPIDDITNTIKKISVNDMYKTK